MSTTEVANVLSSLDFIEDANVYGVMMPGRVYLIIMCIANKQ